MAGKIKNLEDTLGALDVDEIIESCLNALVAGNVIAVPTDTIYGIAALAQSTSAVDKLYQIKRREREKPIAICVGCLEDVRRWGDVTVADEVLEDLLPGPVTLIFKRSALLNPSLNPTNNSVGIRIPKFQFIQDLSKKCNEPLALTSANLSSGISPLKISEFLELWPDLDVIVDNGTIGNSQESRLGSTVVDLTQPDEFAIVRAGCAYDYVVDVLKEKYGFKQR